MNIDFDFFREWAEDKFGDIKVKGEEIRANSIFHPTESDTKYRLWMSPSGGKNKREYGVYHCFDTDRKGTLIGLIMIVEKCSFQEALEIAGGTTLTSDLEKQIDEFFTDKDILQEIQSSLTLPEDCYFINDINHRAAIEASVYLENRKIPCDGLMICLYGKYKDRVVIPYYNSHGELIYFNCRNLNKKGSKYLGPPKELGIGKEDVIYMKYWPKKGSKVYVTEGEFDAITLNICGFNSAACGSKNLSVKHIEYLRDYKIVIALDSDKAGQKALIEWYEKLKNNGVNEFSYVFPPKKVKDWNELYQKTDETIVKAFINKQEKKFSEEDLIDMTFNFLGK